MTETVRLDIELLLPEVADEADRCIDRLSGELQGRPGVEKAHVVAAQGDAPAQLCIHYDPDIIPLDRVRQLARSAGAALTEQYQHLLWTDVEGLGHTRRARTVSDRLRQLPGVVEAEASAAGVIRAEFSRTEISLDQIRSALGDMGVYQKSAGETKAMPTKHEHDEKGDHKGHDHGEEAGGDHGHAHGGIFGANTELYVALLCGVVLGIGFAIEKLTALPDWVPLAFYIGAYGLGGWFTLREAIENLKLKRFEIDTLMLVAAAGAAALGAWAEGALLLFLFSFGHALEHYAMGRAKRAIEALAELAPQTAVVRRDGDTRRGARRGTGRRRYRHRQTERAAPGRRLRRPRPIERQPGAGDRRERAGRQGAGGRR